MKVTNLERASSQFVNRLNSVIKATINTDVRFETQKKDTDHPVIEPSKSFGRTPAFPLYRSEEDPEKPPALFLHARYSVDLAGDGENLQVVGSAVGLWVDVTGTGKKHSPLIRLEYDRYTHSEDRPPAHVHLHANSPELAWVYGSNGLPVPNLHALHFPAGGPQFRPNLEDFLLFLNRERIYQEFRSGWKPAVLSSRRDWELS